MKLLKKLLSAAAAISTVTALTPTIVGCQCSGPDYARLTWNFCVNGELKIYEDDLPLIESKTPLNEKQATSLYYDSINNNGNRFASDIMYNIDANIMKLINDDYPDKHEVTIEINDISFESDLISLSFKFDLYSKKLEEKESHSYFYVNKMK